MLEIRFEIYVFSGNKYSNLDLKLIFAPKRSLIWTWEDYLIPCEPLTITPGPSGIWGWSLGLGLESKKTLFFVIFFVVTYFLSLFCHVSS